MTSRLLEVPCVFVAGRDAQLLAFALDDLLGRGYFDALRPDDRVRIEELAAQVTIVADRRGQCARAESLAADSGLVDYDTAADLLDVSERTVRRLVESGDLPVIKIGRARRVRVVDLNRYVEERAS